MSRICLTILLLCFAVPLQSPAIGPHELVVIANQESADSVDIAQKYVRLRGVPEINLIKVKVPVSDPAQPAEISAEDFTKLIWEPVTSQIQERGIGDHIMGWVYSCDLPHAVKTEPRVSIQGITFLRNKLPKMDDVAGGRYASPLYSGPMSPDIKASMSQTFDVYKTWLGEDMPIPSMILGSTMKYGSTKEQIFRYIRNGIDSDGTAPKGKVYFVESADVRSEKRKWQFKPAADSLLNAGVDCVITNAFPTNAMDVIGIMAGAAFVPAGDIGMYLPGAMGEHLTSFAGALHHNDQTKLTAWLNFGATASAGTVCEPYAMWTKFPNASFFGNYAAGCTMIESFYQSIRCPMQIIIVGEPLACPWGKKAELSIKELNRTVLSGKVRLTPEIKAKTDVSFSRFVCYVDGRTVSEGMTPELDTSKHKNGVHKVRVVGYSTGLVKSQAWVEKELELRNE